MPEDARRGKAQGRQGGVSIAAQRKDRTSSLRSSDHSGWDGRCWVVGTCAGRVSTG